MLPKLNRKRALFVLTKIDEILAWERRSEAERDTRFVELGRYLCEVRAGQYWRLEKLKSFDEFLTRRFPESRRKAYFRTVISDEQHEEFGRLVQDSIRRIEANSMPTSSSPTPSISVAQRHCAKPPGSRSKASLRTWPTGPRKTGTPCSAS